MRREHTEALARLLDGDALPDASPEIRALGALARLLETGPAPAVATPEFKQRLRATLLEQPSSAPTLASLRLPVERALERWRTSRLALVSTATAALGVGGAALVIALGDGGVSELPQPPRERVVEEDRPALPPPPVSPGEPSDASSADGPTVDGRIVVTERTSRRISEATRGNVRGVVLRQAPILVAEPTVPATSPPPPTAEPPKRVIPDAPGPADDLVDEVVQELLRRTPVPIPTAPPLPSAAPAALNVDQAPAVRELRTDAGRQRQVSKLQRKGSSGRKALAARTRLRGGAATSKPGGSPALPVGVERTLGHVTRRVLDLP